MEDAYIPNGFRALQVRKDMSEGGLIRMIGDILCENVSRIVLYETVRVWKLAMGTLLDTN
jgi:hypothetical protein